MMGIQDTMKEGGGGVLLNASHEGRWAQEGISGAVACGTCRRLARIEEGRARGRFVCARCGSTIRRNGLWRAKASGALALGALFLFFPANLLPLVSIEFMGNYNRITALGAVGTLADDGRYLLASLVFLTAILAPGAAVAGIAGALGSPSRFRGVFQNAVSWAVPWMMIEVFFTALVIGIVKFGGVATVTVEWGAVALAGCVALSKASVWTFDSNAVWNNRSDYEATR